MIDTSSDTIVNIMRYCLSDRLDKNMEVVVQDHSPISYAQLMTKRHGKALFKTFGESLFTHTPKLTEDLKLAWVNDTLLESAAVYRVAQARIDKEDDVWEAIHYSLPYSLTLECRRSPTGTYTGLTKFRTNATQFFHQNILRRHLNSSGLLTRMTDCVGDMLSPKWIMYDPRWYKALHVKNEGHHILRSFLSAAMISHVLKDEFCTEVLETDRETVLRDVESFIYLREDETATVVEIVEFLANLEHYGYDVPQHNFTTTVFAGSFETFENRHQDLFGNKFSMAKFITLTDDCDIDEWRFLRELGDEFSPESVIVTDETPQALSDVIIKSHIKDIYNSPIAKTLGARGIKIPELFPKSSGWIRTALEDRLMQLMVMRRHIFLKQCDLESSTLYTTLTSHILLNVSDETERLGLSVVGECLEAQLEINIKNLSEREQVIVSTMIAGWGNLKLFSRNKMNKSWKKALANKETLGKLRQFMFFIIETLNINAIVDFSSYFTCSRVELFVYIETLGEYMLGDVVAEELSEFLNDIPQLQATALVDSWDHCVWGSPMHLFSNE